MMMLLMINEKQDDDVVGCAIDREIMMLMNKKLKANDIYK